MKKIIKESLKQLIADRYLFSLIIIMILLSIIFAVIIGFSIQPSEIKVVSHYSAFGVTQYYKDQWQYLYTLVAFVLVTAALHSIISIKLLLIKVHSLAVMFAWLGIAVMSLGLTISLSLLHFRVFI